MRRPGDLGEYHSRADGAARRPPAARRWLKRPKQFEALLIAQLLKEARGDEGGWLGSGEDAGNATAAGLAEEQFAQALAQQRRTGTQRATGQDFSAGTQ